MKTFYFDNMIKFMPNYLLHSFYFLNTQYHRNLSHPCGFFRRKNTSFFVFQKFFTKKFCQTAIFFFLFAGSAICFWVNWTCDAKVFNDLKVLKTTLQPCRSSAYDLQTTLQPCRSSAQDLQTTLQPCRNLAWASPRPCGEGLGVGSGLQYQNSKYSFFLI
jgi:hypothetical protein